MIKRKEDTRVTLQQKKDRICSAAFIPMDGIEFTETDWFEMYKEYLIALKKIRKYIKWMRKEIKELQSQGYILDKETIDWRKMILDSEKELIENIMSIERYLPYQYRKFQKQFNDRYVNRIQDNRVKKGYTNEKLIKGNISEIIVDKYFQKQFKDLIHSELSEQEYKCIEMYFGKEKRTQQQIADELGITKQAVSKYIKKARQKIKIIQN